MGIGSIFAIVKLGNTDTEKVFSIQYQENESHIFEQLFDNWSDFEYLFDFFHEHTNDLHNSHWQKKFGKKLSIEQAIDITVEHALDFEKTILALAEKNTTNGYGNSLNQIFVPLSKTFHEPLKTALKSYGTGRDSWLRIYAVHIQDVYIITGGAIKLTELMQDRPHTQKQLDSMKLVVSELKRNGFTKNTDFDFVYVEV